MPLRSPGARCAPRPAPLHLLRAAPILAGLLLAAPIPAQAPAGVPALRTAHALQAGRVAGLDSARHAAALRLLAVAEQIVSAPGPARAGRSALLGEARQLADRIAAADAEMIFAAPAAAGARRRLAAALAVAIAALPTTGDEARRRELERELAELRARDEQPAGRDTLAGAAPTLTALAGVVAREHERLLARHRLQEELRLFLGGLRLFDETGMPPSARSAESGGQAPGCPVTSCASIAPADVPLAHFGPGEAADAAAGGESAMTLSSLARLQTLLATHAATGRGPLADAAGTVIRETAVAAGLIAFRGAGDFVWTGGPKLSGSFQFSWPLGTGTQLVVEPAIGGRSLRAEAGSFSELTGEARATLADTRGAHGFRWQATTWHRGRLLSDPLPLPGYLEPGRVESGLAGRLFVRLRPGWELEGGGGADLVRYSPDEWKVLDRHGVSASLGLARRGDSGYGRISLLGSSHGFARDVASTDPQRRDTRWGVEADGAVEGAVVLRVSAGLGWNDSRLPAYDFHAGRAAASLSAPWGAGAIQVYGAFAHQDYRNPGPEGDRVAPSDHDSGSIIAIQYSRPIAPTRGLGLRAEWSRSETGFRNDFYQRFGASVQLTFRRLSGG